MEKFYRYSIAILFLIVSSGSFAYCGMNDTGSRQELFQREEDLTNKNDTEAMLDLSKSFINQYDNERIESDECDERDDFRKDHELPEGAVKWLRKAAEGGNKRAQELLIPGKKTKKYHVIYLNNEEKKYGYIFRSYSLGHDSYYEIIKNNKPVFSEIQSNDCKGEIFYFSSDSPILAVNCSTSTCDKFRCFSDVRFFSLNETSPKLMLQIERTHIDRPLVTKEIGNKNKCLLSGHGIIEKNGLPTFLFTYDSNLTLDLNVLKQTPKTEKAFKSWIAKFISDKKDIYFCYIDRSKN